MSVWWLAVDANGGHCTYEELRERRVVAQGWPKLKDLTSLCALSSDPASRPAFAAKVAERTATAYPRSARDLYRAPIIMWRLLQIREGDLVVAIEGRRVRGICQVQADAPATYRLDLSGPYEYNQTVCAPVEWVDWDRARLGRPPVAPRQSVMGVARLRNEADAVVNAWRCLGHATGGTR